MPTITEQLIMLGAEMDARLAAKESEIDALKKQNAIYQSDLADADKQIDGLREQIRRLQPAGGGGQSTPRTGTVIFRTNGTAQVKWISINGELEVQSQEPISLAAGTYTAKRLYVPNDYTPEIPEGVSFTVKPGETIEVAVNTVAALVVPLVHVGGSPPPRRIITLPADFEGWDSKDIQETRVEIIMDGGFLMRSQQYGGQRLRLTDSMLYGGRNLYRSATPGGLFISLNQSILADLLKDPKGNPVRGVMTPEMKAAGWSVLKASMSHYGMYGEAKDLGKPGYPIVWDKVYGSIEIIDSQIGGLDWEHQARTYGGVELLIGRSELWNWFNRIKGDKVNGGPCTRAHGTKVTIYDSRLGFANKIGSEDQPYATEVSLSNVQFFGLLQWPGNKKIVKQEKVFWNGKPLP